MSLSMEVSIDHSNADTEYFMSPFIYVIIYDDISIYRDIQGEPKKR